MFGKNIVYRIAGTLSLLCSAAVVISAQPTQPQASLPPFELEQAKQRVIAFCAEWKKNKIDTMYVMMSDAARAILPKATFTNIYNVQADSAGKLVSSAVKEAMPTDEGCIVKMNLGFHKGNPPILIDGTHNFYLIKEAGKWKVKTIVPPIAPPVPGGSGGGHPGE